MSDQFLIEVHIEFQQTIHITLHALQVGRDGLSVLHLASYEGLDYLVSLLTSSLMVLFHQVLAHLIRLVVLIKPL